MFLINYSESSSVHLLHTIIKIPLVAIIIIINNIIIIILTVVMSFYLGNYMFFVQNNAVSLSAQVGLHVLYDHPLT